jgi:solute:Na+ symporter, SSS family
MIDAVVLLAYLALLAWIGSRFARRQTSTENYFLAKRSIPPWAMGFSLLATLVSSVTFVAYPGSSYAGNWSLLVPGFLVVIVLLLVGQWIIPFYRKTIGVSAYEYFQQRFGRKVRLYASFAFSMAHFSKMGFVFYLMALTVNSVTGWNIDAMIVGVAVVMIFYALRGGIEAVVWTDVIQGFVMAAGVLVCLGYLFWSTPGGAPAALSLAAEKGKLSLGTMRWSFETATIPVLVVYGFFWYFQRYTADQTVVQRYLLAANDRAALKGVATGALFAVPVWALFMLVGTATWAYFQLTGETLPATITKPDQVFPYFLATKLPDGWTGLFLAALSGSAMTMVASDLNSLAAVGVQDFYKPIRPESTDEQRLRVAKLLVAAGGVGAAATAMLISRAQGNALSMWFAVSAIASGGLAGLFLLAVCCPRANSAAALSGIVASLVVTAWAVLTQGAGRFVDLGKYNFTWDNLMIGVVGHLILFSVGTLVSWTPWGREEPERSLPGKARVGTRFASGMDRS